MYNLMIVDDDFWMRKYIKEQFNWPIYNVRFAEEACDAEEALEKLTTTPIDILLLDISMPGLNGVELAEIIVKKFPGMKIILQSGYKEFEYARKAVSLGLLDYILKPIEEKHLLAVVLRAVSELAEKSKNIDAGLELQRERLYVELLTKPLEQAYIVEKMKTLYLDLRPESLYSVWIIELDKYDPAADHLKTNAIDFVQEVLKQKFTFFMVRGDAARHIVVIYFNESESMDEMIDAMKMTVENICITLQKRLGLTVTVGIGPCYRGIDRLFQSHAAAEETLKQKFFVGANKVYFYPVEIESSDDTKSFSFKEMKVRITDAVLMCESDHIAACLGELKLYFLGNRSREAENIKRILTQLIHEIMITIPLGEMENSDFSDDDTHYNFSFSKCETFDEIFIVLKEMLEAMMTKINEKRKNHSKKIILDVLNIIDKSYSQDLYLEKIALVVGVHPAYLSRIFKRETGETLLQYIMKYRMEKSKQLLSNPHIKIYEVAKIVGYENILTFTRIFKKMAGMTPTEFKEKYTAKR